MTPAVIGWLVSVILWMIFSILNYYANQTERTYLASTMLSLEWICIGFAWIFVGFTHGWW